MGYHVTCSGAELIRRLCTDPDRFLGEPHALHIVALCTMVDDEVVDWLMQFEMAFDSLTGPDAAFILFYNEAELSAEPNDYSPDTQSMQPIRVEVPAKVLRKGIGAVDAAIRYRRGVWLSRDVLVQSMTYASDAVARELGIMNRLPCLVLFDEPRSGEYYVMPLDRDLAVTLRDIRGLISAYREGEAHTGYMQALHNWHAIKGQLDEARKVATRLKAEYFAPGGQFANLQATERLARAEAELLAGRSKAFRRQVNLVWSANPPGVTWPEIRRISSRAAELRRLIHAAGRGEDYRVARRASALGIKWPANDMSELVQALQREADSLTDQLMTRLRPSSEAPKDEDSEWHRLECACHELENLLQSKLEIIATMPRPRVGSYVDKLIARRRRKSATRIVRLSATTALDRGTNLLDALSKGINLLSS